MHTLAEVKIKKMETLYTKTYAEGKEDTSNAENDGNANTTKKCENNDGRFLSLNRKNKRRTKLVNFFKVEDLIEQEKLSRTKVVKSQ